MMKYKMFQLRYGREIIKNIVNCDVQHIFRAKDNDDPFLKRICCIYYSDELLMA